MIRSSWWMLPVVYCVLSAPVLSVRADEAGGPVADLQGAWICDGAREDGKDAPRFVGIIAVIQGDRLTWGFPSTDGQFHTLKGVTFRADPTNGHFDYWRTADAAKVHRRLYTVSGDVLRWSSNTDVTVRPTSFDAGRLQFSMRRMQEAFVFRTVIDPDDDCTLRRYPDKIQVRVPAGDHDLWYGGTDPAKRFNAPRLLRTARGDFTIQVKMTSDWDLGPGLESGRRSHGAGLVVWDSEQQYLRLERLHFVQKATGKDVWFTTPLYDRRDQRVNKVDGTYSADFFKGRSTWLRLSRSGQVITTSISHDGNNWTETGRIATEFPDEVQVGLHALNGSTRDFVVDFEDLRFDSPNRTAASAFDRSTGNSANIEGWGTVVDPNNDCTIRKFQEQVQIRVPGGEHDLWFGTTDPSKRFNAPRLLSTIQGDFTAQVKMTADWTLGPKLPSGRCWNGAGLVVWDSDKQYLRWERIHSIHGATGKEMWAVTPLYDAHGRRVNQALATEQADFFKSRSTWLRVTRSGQVITTALSHDGTAWTETGRITTEFPDQVQVGVDALNGSTEEFTVEFEDFRLDSPNQARTPRLAEGTALFNGRDLTGWTVDSGDRNAWRVEGGELVVRGNRDDRGWLLTEREFGDFTLRFEFRVGTGANSGVALRTGPGANPSGANLLEIQLQDDAYYADRPGNHPTFGTTGALYGLALDRKAELKPVEEWNDMEIKLVGASLRVAVNGTETLRTTLDKFSDRIAQFPDLKRRTGWIGLQNNADGTTRFRNIVIAEITPDASSQTQRTHLEGTVSKVSDGSVEISLPETDRAAVGDKVEIVVDIPGLDEPALVAVGRVTALRPGGVTAVIETSTGTVAAGQHARIIAARRTSSVERPAFDRSKRAFIGAYMREAQRPDVKPAGLTEAAGVFVRALMPGSPADQSELKVGDVILKIDDELIADYGGWSAALANRKPGDRAALEILRDAKYFKRDVVFGEYPGKAAYANRGLESAKQGDAAWMGVVGDWYYMGDWLPQDKAEAARWYRRGAEQGFAPCQAALGLIYERGEGVTKDLQQAVVWHRAAAEQGHVEAQHRLGMALDNGNGVAKNPPEAYKWYRRAAEQGYSWGQYNAGACLANGYGVSRDDRAAVQFFRPAAEDGIAEAQNFLGYMYEQGRGVDKDEAAAARLYRLSADQGYVRALINLGNLYETGRGVEQDSAEAAKLFRVVAEKGNLDARRTLGIWYQHGHGGVSRDYAQSVKWLRLAADQGDAAAQIHLGNAFEHGWGEPQNKQSAFHWYKRAADQNHVSGQYNVGYCYADGVGVQRDDQTAVQWFRLAADQGSAVAQFRLGTMYRDGRGVTKDEEQAAEWLYKAAQQGQSNAQTDLGCLYMHGVGIQKDYPTALKWLRQAAAQNNSDALANLGIMYENGWGVPQNRAEGLAYYRKSADLGNEYSKQVLRDRRIQP